MTKLPFYNERTTEKKHYKTNRTRVLFCEIRRSAILRLQYFKFQNNICEINPNVRMKVQQVYY